MNKDILLKKLRTLIKLFIPELILNIRRKAILKWMSDEEFNKRSDRQFSGKSPREVFTTIYKKKLWGGGRVLFRLWIA